MDFLRAKKNIKRWRNFICVLLQVFVTVFVVVIFPIFLSAFKKWVNFCITMMNGLMCEKVFLKLWDNLKNHTTRFPSLLLFLFCLYQRNFRKLFSYCAINYLWWGEGIRSPERIKIVIGFDWHLPLLKHSFGSSSLLSGQSNSPSHV